MTCPICHQTQHRLLQLHEQTDHLFIQYFSTLHPQWTAKDGVCSRCVDKLDTRLQLQHGTSNASFQRGYILPFGERLQANDYYKGRNTTICYIDSGFYPHPDLTQPVNRIKVLADITDWMRPWEYFLQAHNHAWHGTMTSVTGSGNGYRSNGYYRSLAPESSVVLLKVYDETSGQISEHAIVQAIDWAIRFREVFEIDIISLSVSGDFPESYRTSAVSQAIRRAFEAGLIVICAIGNDIGAALLPPASSYHALAVGGLDDRNTLHIEDDRLYHSTFGRTLDGLFKPDVIAPAVWIAAPLLPNTQEAEQAEKLFDLANSSSDEIRALYASFHKSLHLPEAWYHFSPTELRHRIIEHIWGRKLITPYYQHVDGTSFAAPLVASVAAQMLEANPDLPPIAIYAFLQASSTQIPYTSTHRQGNGVINPAKAVYAAEQEYHAQSDYIMPIVDYERRILHFEFHDHDAGQVTLRGDFNGWHEPGYHFQQYNNENWVLDIPLPPPGTYRYKLVVDGSDWRIDARNMWRQPDGFGGFNSVFSIK